MKKHLVSCKAFLLGFLFLFLTTLSGHEALADYTPMGIPVTFNQTEARNQLYYINNERANVGVAPLEYDYGMEQMAMQRAAEIAVSYAHSRPDDEAAGIKPMIYEYAQGAPWRAHSENIYRPGFEYCSAESAYEAFEGSRPHYEAMISSSYTAVGVGCAIVNGYTCWVQEFLSCRTPQGYTDPDNSFRYVTVNVGRSRIHLGTDEYRIWTMVYDNETLPTVHLMAGDVPFDTNAVWSVANPSIAEIRNGKLYGKNIGQTTITASNEIGSITLDVYVNVTYIGSSDTNISFLHSGWTYNGEKKKPAIKVTYKGITLKKGVDYTISYGANKNVNDPCYVKINGIGNFNGDLTKYFSIKPASQNVSVKLPSKTVRLGSSSSFTVKGYGTATCTSSSPSVFTASCTNGSGTIYPIAPGTAKLTVTLSGDANHKAASKTVTVKVWTAQPKIKTLKNTSSGIKIGWNKVKGATYYRVFYKTANGSWKKLATTRGTSYTFKKGKHLKKYTFTVRAMDRKGHYCSTFQNRKSIIRLAAPSIASVRKTSSDRALVRWNKVSGVTGYQIYYRSTSAKRGKYIRVRSASSLNRTLTKLIKGRKYNIRIRSYKAVSGKAVYSGWSKAKQIRM